MTQLILHHYPSSPFAEKTRLILGFKGLPWSSVFIPSIMPKPDLVALTGGYRKTPVLQIGADIYCDTALIADVLEEIQPAPSLYPRAIGAASRLLAQWADATLFWTAVPYTLQPAGAAVLFEGSTPEQMKAFAEDRGALRQNAPRMRLPESSLALDIYLSRLEEMLGGQVFLFGSEPSIGDFSVAHCLWFVRRGGPVAEIIERYRLISAWLDRMQTFSVAPSAKLTSSDALRIAAESTPQQQPGLIVDTHGLALGETVWVSATDYGTDVVEGQLYGATRDRLSISRQGANGTQLVVHFPRLGFEMRKPK